jgi:uncharacterized membrane protein
MMDTSKPDGKEVARLETLSVQTHWSAPIPHPETLRQYDTIMPGIVERIITMAEKEADARHTMMGVELANNTAQIANNSALITNDAFRLQTERDDGKVYRKEVRIGQFFAFFIMMVGISASVVCAHIGQPWVAGVLGGSTLISVVNAMLNARGKSKL